MKMLATLCFCALSVASVWANNVASVGSNLLIHFKSAPNTYSDGATLLKGERYEIIWMPNSGDPVTQAVQADATGALDVNVKVDTSKYANGKFVVVYCDTRTAKDTLGTTVFAKYLTTKATIYVSKDQAGVTTAAVKTGDKVETQAASAEDIAATTATGSITIVNGKPTLSVTATGTANLVIESSTDLKNWTAEQTVRAFSADSIKVDSTAPAKFFRILKK